MNDKVVFDWKSFAALGFTVVCIILASKIDAPAAERVLDSLSNSLKELAVAKNSNH